MKLSKTWTGAALVAGALLLSACSGAQPSADDDAPVTDGDFTVTVLSDPGSLDPHSSFAASNQQLMAFLYDTLVKQIGDDLQPQLADSWTETPTEAVLTLHPDVTCADGTALTAEDVVANIEYVADPANGSPLIGLAVPVGATATADGDTVTITSPTPASFLVQGLSSLPIVCGAGLADRSTLERSANGTGPFTLGDTVAGDHYTLERRDDYTWGPGGTTTADAGIPATATVRVVSSEGTAANLLLSGESNASSVSGPDVARLEAQDLFSVPAPAMWGEFFFNQADGRASADEAVRIALTQALKLDELLAISTSGKGSVPTSLIGAPVCEADPVTDSLPTYDTDAATEVLSALSGTELKFIFPANFGSETSEAAVAMWADAGASVTATGMSNNDLFETLYATGDWDIVWFPADGQNPDQVRTNFSGPSALEGGNNFASIQNDTYDQLTAEASTQPGVDGCANWTAGERALLESADVVPFSLQDYPIWGSEATFEASFGIIQPTTIRVTG